MNRNMKRLLCCAVALMALLLTACRSGGGKTTEPPRQTTPPAATLPKGETVEEGDEPIATESVPNTDPHDTVTEPSGDPAEDPTEPPAATQPPRETEPAQPPVETEPAPPTEPRPTEPPATTEPHVGGSDPRDVTYEEYLAMSPQEQQAHYEQFPSLEAYIEWHNTALAEYEENQDSIDVTGGIDIGDFVTP